MFVLLLAALAVLVTSSRSGKPLWPMPVIAELGKERFDLSEGFIFQQEGEDSARLGRACDRYSKLVGAKVVPPQGGQSAIIGTCTVRTEEVMSEEKEAASLEELGVDEAYRIEVTTDGACSIESKTIWGALHAMETFTQLLTREDDGVISNNYAPLVVEDKPRYAHRGVLIDSARHFLPVNVVKSMIDTLPMSKFNILHWHIVDAQSFPVDTPSAPNMQRGSFGGQIYTMDDIKGIQNYAVDRGVRIVYEFDGPGHTAAWGKGYPEIMAKCPEYAYNVNDFAMNPTIDGPYDVLNSIVKDVVTTTNTKWFHLGGDEVVYGCWASDKSITDYMQANNIATFPELLALYVEKAGDIAADYGTTTIFWEDTFVAGVRPPKTAIFDVWTDAARIANVTSAGYKVIAAPQQYWYLDHADNTWLKMYEYEPTVDLDEHAASLIIGGETSMWGEKVDSDNIHAKVWPTAAAVGERLWSVRNHTLPITTQSINDRIGLRDGERDMRDVHARLARDDEGVADATERILIFRCRMSQRGYAASPIQPGYCPINYV